MNNMLRRDIEARRQVRLPRLGVNIGNAADEVRNSERNCSHCPLLLSPMDWFEKITGFRELPYAATQALLSTEEGKLCSKNSPRLPAIGRLDISALQELRARVSQVPPGTIRCRTSCVEGDARQLHSEPVNTGALFQVASQFNLLEMVGPSITPEHGVSGYAHDRTQGPACAIAAGAGTIFRNYLVDVSGQRGQKAHRQIDCLADLGAALGNVDGSLWTMKNGYALCTESGLDTIDSALAHASSERIDELRGLLRIGLHWDVEVTDVVDRQQLVSQAYCSALPVAYSRLERPKWQRFATLVLEAAYEATLLAGVLNSARGASKKVLLTRLGGGAFGNDFAWINAAIERAIRLVEMRDLDIQIVCYGSIPSDVHALVKRL